LRENLTRLGLEAEIVAADILKWEPEEPFDAILLDAPCSATGTIRRNPDIPYLKQPSDLAGLVALQQQMLAKALDFLKPGGVLVYCTCSLEPAEGPEQISRLLGARSDIALAPIEPEEIGGRAEWLDEHSMLSTLPRNLQLSDPELSGMDGFYAARLEKVE
jgi:16S rRNA (cytosine967-C5)-methyltransferase